MYTVRLPNTDKEWETDDDTTDDVMVQIIALAHRFVVPTFIKAMEHALIAHIITEDVLPWADTIVFAFENLPFASQVLRLLVDAYCLRYTRIHHNVRAQMVPGLPQLPYDSMVRVMLRYSESIRDRSYKKLIACDYHNHGFDVERKNCKS
jgi:hypothetical protein